MFDLDIGPSIVVGINLISRIYKAAVVRKKDKKPELNELRNHLNLPFIGENKRNYSIKTMYRVIENEKYESEILAIYNKSSK